MSKTSDTAEEKFRRNLESWRYGHHGLFDALELEKRGFKRDDLVDLDALDASFPRAGVLYRIASFYPPWSLAADELANVSDRCLEHLYYLTCLAAANRYHVDYQGNWRPASAPHLPSALDQWNEGQSSREKKI